MLLVIHGTIFHDGVGHWLGYRPKFALSTYSRKFSCQRLTIFAGSAAVASSISTSERSAFGSITNRAVMFGNSAIPPARLWRPCRLLPNWALRSTHSVNSPELRRASGFLSAFVGIVLSGKYQLATWTKPATFT